VLDNLDEINEDDVAEIAMAATDDIEFYKQAMNEFQEKVRPVSNSTRTPLVRHMIC
jgi:hypothetical protein